MKKVSLCSLFLFALHLIARATESDIVVAVSSEVGIVPTISYSQKTSTVVGKPLVVEERTARGPLVRGWKYQIKWESKVTPLRLFACSVLREFVGSSGQSFDEIARLQTLRGRDEKGNIIGAVAESGTLVWTVPSDLQKRTDQRIELELFVESDAGFIRSSIFFDTVIDEQTLRVEPLPPMPILASKDRGSVQFKVNARSVRPGNPVLWRAWQLEFAVSAGVASSLGNIQVRNAAGQLIREEQIKTFGDNPQGGIVFLEEPDDGRSSGYSLKSEETFAVSFSTAGLAGANIVVTSVEIVAADFGGVNVQYGDLVSSSVPVSLTVPVENVSSGVGGNGGGGGGGTVVVPEPQPVDITADYMTTDVQVAGRICAFFLKKPLPFDITLDLVVGNAHWQFASEDALTVLHNGDRTLFVVFPMPPDLVGALSGGKPRVQLFR